MTSFGIMRIRVGSEAKDRLGATLVLRPSIDLAYSRFLEGLLEHTDVAADDVPA